MKVLITGSEGQLGSEIREISNSFNYDFIFTDITVLDLKDLDNITKKIDIFSPDIIINCAAYTDVDQAEKNKDLTNIINHLAVGIISKWTYNNKRKIIHISSDYVFNGKSKYPIDEKVKTDPINFYGYTKMLGEQVCLKNDPNSIIIRTSWLYSSFGNNFVKTMCASMKLNESLSIISDQMGSPTYAADLAKALLIIIDKKKWHPGIYHYSNEGETNWYEFACIINELYGFNSEINEISSFEYFAKTKRPSYSILDKTKIKETFKLKIPHYKDSLTKCIKLIKNEG